MNKKETMQTINELQRRCGETQFRTAVQHLFDTGHQNFHEENVAATKEKIQKTTKPNAIMTADFQYELLDCCLALSKLPVWDVLLYVKLYMSMDGDNTLLHEEAERAVRTWNNELRPQAWQDACADPELSSEIAQHKDYFSAEEIKVAVRCVADRQ